jgi:hypothetical protein
LIGTKYDYFTRAGQEEKAEITNQVTLSSALAFLRLTCCLHPCLSVIVAEHQIRQGHEGAAHLLLVVALDQHPKDLQGRAQQGVRPQVQRQEDRHHWRSDYHVLTKGRKHFEEIVLNFLVLH